MSVSTKPTPVGRRPIHSTLRFEEETDPAIIQQLHRTEYVALQNLVSGRRVLDIGCGSGYTCHYLVQRGGAISAVGLDVDDSLISHNNSTNRDERVEFVFNEPGSALPFSDASFDCVTCFEVLEHVPMHIQRHLVREAARLVSLDGICVFSTPHQPVYSPDGVSRNPDHIRELRAEEFEDLIRESFDEVALLGQEFSNEAALAAFQRSHLLSHHPAARFVQWATCGVLTKLVRRSRPKAPFRVAKNAYAISPCIDTATIVMLAVCQKPRTEKPDSGRAKHARRFEKQEEVSE